MAPPEPSHLRALVDMGSNGVRFSISDVSFQTARVLPTLFQDRAGISLYDAQYSTGTKAPVPASVIEDICQAFQRFKSNCADFEVPEQNIRVVATEATREAMNSRVLRDEIKQRVGWEVELLSKDSEGRIGALGIASSYTDVNGLVMDLGGGSVQMSWMETHKGEVDVQWSTSLPYGAAALTRRLEEAEGSKVAEHELELEVRKALASAYSALQQTVSARSSDRTKVTNFSLFLSGGGFRGWGHILMDAHPIEPYPIPIINGFKVPSSFFQDMPAVQARVDQTAADESGIFRVSKRRRSQVPAISFLIRQLVACVPQIADVRFAQGGIREGLLFKDLPMNIRAQQPLAAATAKYASTSTKNLLELLQSAIPNIRATGSSACRCPPHILDLLVPYANLLNYYSGLPKEARAAASLHSTTTGILAGVHGVSHLDRATLSLLLCQRWGGGVAPTDTPFLGRLQKLAGSETAWWCNYLGRVGLLLGTVYPASRVAEGDGRLSMHGTTKKGKHGNEIVLRVQMRPDDGGVKPPQAWEDALSEIEKVGKKKHWIGGRDGWGFKVRARTA